MEHVPNDNLNDVKMLDVQMHLYKHAHACLYTERTDPQNVSDMNPTLKSDGTTPWPHG